MTHFKLLYRLDGRDAYLLWFSNDQDGVVTDAEGRVPSFDNEQDLLAFAERLGVSVSDETPKLHDLDAVERWVAAPRADEVDYSTLLSAWNLFADVASSVPSAGQAFATAANEHDALYDKLFWGNNLPAVTPDDERFEPAWTESEVQRLADLLAAGLRLFRAALIVAG